MSNPSSRVADELDDARTDVDPVMTSQTRDGSDGRLPAATHLAHVTLQVADLARSLDYYQRVLGLHRMTSPQGSALLGTEDGATPLVELVERRGANPVPHNGRLGLYHFAILLPDRPALGRFVAHLAEIGERAGASDHLVSEALYLRDPDGLGIEVYRDRSRSEWRTVGGQLEMATNPLDIASVVNSGGGVKWTGMPAGTVMGHVHLHVGDIPEASAFYHEALGFDRMVWSYPGALFLAAGGYHHHLGLNTWAGPHALPATDADARLLEWRIVMPAKDDVAAVARRLEQAGHVVERSGDVERIARDPWGTAVRLMSER